MVEVMRPLGALVAQPAVVLETRRAGHDRTLRARTPSPSSSAAVPPGTTDARRTEGGRRRGAGRTTGGRDTGAPKRPRARFVLKEDSGTNVLRREGPLPDCRPSGDRRELASPVQLPTSGQPPPGSQKNSRSAGPPPFSGTAYETTSPGLGEDGFRGAPEKPSGAGQAGLGSWGPAAGPMAPMASR